MAPSDLERAAREFYVALAAVLKGDAEPMLGIWSHADDVSYMGPFGELVVGWEPIRAAWVAQAAQKLRGSIEPEELHIYDSAALGVAVGFERGTVEADGQPVAVDIRATSIYRREDGRWLMVGHHTDRLG
jgi:ketosteroid isomerase-like protein